MKSLTANCYLSLMSFGICFTTIGPALKEIQGEIVLTSSQLGLFTTVLSIGLIISVLTAGVFIDRFRIKSVMLAGQFSVTLGLITFAFIDSFPVGLFAFFMIGLGGGLIEIVVNTLISEIYAKKRTSALNLLHGFFGVGALLGPILMGYLIEGGFGWRLGYGTVALFSATVLIFQILTSYPKKVSSDHIDFDYFFKILKNPYTILLGAIMILYVGSEMGINYWSVLYMELGLGITKITASSFLSLFWIAMTMGRFVCFVVAKKIGGKKLLISLSFISVFAFAVFMSADSQVTAGGSIFLLGLAFSGIFPTIMALGIDRFPKALGTITGLLMTFMGGGALLFPWFIGMIADIFTLKVGMLSILLFIIMLTFSTGMLGLKRIRQP